MLGRARRRTLCRFLSQTAGLVLELALERVPQLHGLELLELELRLGLLELSAELLVLVA
jgi:hypothetical protein